MDEATASKKRISFARVCIEVEISSELPLSFEIEMEKGDNRTVRVEYSWVPKKCDICKAFGHLTDKCFRVPSTTEPATQNARAPRRVWVQRQQEEAGEQEPESISENSGNSTNEGVVNTATLEVNQITTVVDGVEESNGIEKNGPFDGDVCNEIMIQSQNQAQPDMEPAADNDVRILQNLSVVPYVDRLEHFVNPEDSVAMEEFEEELVDFIRRTEGIGDGEMSEDVLSVEETPYFSDKVTEPLAIMDTPIQHKNDVNRYRATSPDNIDALRRVGWKLAQFAKNLHVEFEYREFVCNSLADLDASILDLRPGETVVVNSMFELHQLLAQPNAIDNVLGTIKEMKPKIVTIVEEEANHNGPI
ncbi:hypothetical protein IFM89_007952 [Coptis chinensis]|uniref:Zinc knuckle CX2CX4HX4C domain-containing protein n=1 Tax=Coptis chinensis TaxID=261450 RepID=A0A835MDD2_9MAGN|nr:hypothetical protein IFM89_007952 [Coptis chinensis]